MNGAGFQPVSTVTAGHSVESSAGDRSQSNGRTVACKKKSFRTKNLSPEPQRLHFKKAMQDLDVVCVMDPERFLAHPEMLDMGYLESSSLDGSMICQRIKILRKGDVSRGYEDQGVIYWQHVLEQQKALEKLGAAVEVAFSQTVFTMERGGTQLYDFLLPYIPEGGASCRSCISAKRYYCAYWNTYQQDGRESL